METIGRVRFIKGCRLPFGALIKDPFRWNAKTPQRKSVNAASIVQHFELKPVKP